MITVFVLHVKRILPKADSYMRVLFHMRWTWSPAACKECAGWLCVSLTLVAQLDVQQCVDAVHGRPPHQRDGVGAAGGQTPQQGAQVVERHHVLE